MPLEAVDGNHSPDPMDGSQGGLLHFKEFGGHLHFKELGGTWHGQVIRAVSGLIWACGLRVGYMVHTQCYHWGIYVVCMFCSA